MSALRHKPNYPVCYDQEDKVLTIKQTEEFINLLQIAPLKYQAFFTHIIYIGMRHGEMLGLEWKNIGFETRVIHIQRTSNYTKARRIYTDTTKTKRSQRTLKISHYIMDLLKKISRATKRGSVNDR